MVCNEMSLSDPKRTETYENKLVLAIIDRRSRVFFVFCSLRVIKTHKHPLGLTNVHYTPCTYIHETIDINGFILVASDTYSCFGIMTCLFWSHYVLLLNHDLACRFHNILLVKPILYNMIGDDWG